MMGTHCASKRTYAGLFLVSLATLMFEILLTRIFSVTMWYHYAFMAISMALFGMTVGAVLVYLLPGHFTHERTTHHLALGALCFAAAIVGSVIVHLRIPVMIDLDGARSAAAAPLVATYVVMSVPFVFSGVCVALALTRFTAQVSALYAADMAGAACGCVVLVLILNVIDGPTTVIVTAALASAGAILFASEARAAGLVRAAVATSILLALFAAVNAGQSPILRVTWSKDTRATRLLYEKWNSFSRIAVTGDTRAPVPPRAWGISPTYSTNRKLGQLQISIDAAAGSVITAFNGDVSRLDYLKYDITNFAHYLKRDARVLIVGSGGGRDILSALTFGQRSVVAVEINRDILRTVNDTFGDFSGHLDRDPRVTLVNDEARSYLASTRDRYDIIQLSFVDTAAATAAGAYVLTENSLYTEQAWTLMLQRLNPGGILTVTRWSIGALPGEIYKATALASTALRRLGIDDPRGHIIVLRVFRAVAPRYGPVGTGTILVSDQPFSPPAVAAAEDVARRLRFEVLVDPRTSHDPVLDVLESGHDLDAFTRAFPLKISPPTDDSPFFFNMVQPRTILHTNPWAQGTELFNTDPVLLLVVLLAAVVALTLLCIGVPLGLAQRGKLRGTSPLLTFFACIGIGFMMVEISQMQRLIIFLGHPTYGLSVVLFSLLVSSGLGSLMTGTIRPAQAAGAATLRLWLLLAALLVFGAVTPHAVVAFRGATTALRILVAVSILCPLGVFMGMAFPLGMKLASRDFDTATPWLWGVNGATSVCASVLAVVIAMSVGISASFWTGVGCYAVALMAFAAACRRARHRASGPAVVPSLASVALPAPNE